MFKDALLCMGLNSGSCTPYVVCTSLFYELSLVMGKLCINIIEFKVSMVPVLCYSIFQLLDDHYDMQ